MKRYFAGIFLFSLMIISSTIWSQKISEEIPNELFFKQAIQFKPINYSNISLINGAAHSGFHFGLEYERLIKGMQNITISIPVTYAHYYTGFISDLNYKGYQFYMAPGVKLYAQSFHKMKGYAVSGHLLMGVNRYQFDSGMSGNQGKNRYNFIGFLINNHYLLRLNDQWGLNFELGAGIRYRKLMVDYNVMDFEPMEPAFTTKDTDLVPIMNVTIGFQYKF